jgi:hypothetical protein
MVEFLLSIRDVQLRIKNQPSLQTANDEENDGRAKNKEYEQGFYD